MFRYKLFSVRWKLKLLNFLKDSVLIFQKLFEIFFIIFTVHLSQIQALLRFCKLNIGKGKKTPYSDNDIVMKCPKVPS